MAEYLRKRISRARDGDALLEIRPPSTQRHILLPHLGVDVLESCDTNLEQTNLEYSAVWEAT